MAKVKTQPPDVPRPEVARIASILAKPALALRDYWDVGDLMETLAADRAVARRGSGWRQAVARGVGVSIATLVKSLQLRRLYDRDGLSELERTGAGWRRVTIVFPVEPARSRHRLLRKA